MTNSDEKNVLINFFEYDPILQISLGGLYILKRRLTYTLYKLVLLFVWFTHIFLFSNVSLFSTLCVNNFYIIPITLPLRGMFFTILIFLIGSLILSYHRLNNSQRLYVISILLLKVNFFFFNRCHSVTVEYLQYSFDVDILYNHSKVICVTDIISLWLPPFLYMVNISRLSLIGEMSGLCICQTGNSWLW